MRTRETVLALNFEVFEGTISSDSSARSSIKKAELHQIRFVDFFDRIGLFVDRCGDGAESNWAACILGGNGGYDFLVDFVKAVAIDFQEIECSGSDVLVNTAIGSYLCVVADAAEKAVRDAGSAAAPASYLVRCLVVDLDFEQPR